MSSLWGVGILLTLVVMLPVAFLAMTFTGDLNIAIPPQGQVWFLELQQAGFRAGLLVEGPGALTNP